MFLIMEIIDTYSHLRTIVYDLYVINDYLNMLMSIERLL